MSESRPENHGLTQEDQKKLVHLNKMKFLHLILMRDRKKIESECEKNVKSKKFQLLWFWLDLLISIHLAIIGQLRIPKTKCANVECSVRKPMALKTFIKQ